MPSGQPRRLRALIVDDNSASREILHAILVEWNMSVDLVASGKEALAALVTAISPYDLVLMDWKMPGLDGIETVKAMRGVSGLTTLPTVLMISAYVAGGHEGRRRRGGGGLRLSRQADRSGDPS